MKFHFEMNCFLIVIQPRKGNHNFGVKEISSLNLKIHTINKDWFEGNNNNNNNNNVEYELYNLETLWNIFEISFYNKYYHEGK